ncbi:uncharacterized protein TM35_000601310, partial [Trypanosoma theileri]
MTMKEMMRHVLCVLVLMLCCAYGCVRADPQKPKPQPSTEDQAAGYGVGNSGTAPASGAVPGGLGPGTGSQTPSNTSRLGTGIPGVGVGDPMKGIASHHVTVDTPTDCTSTGTKDVGGKAIPCVPPFPGTTTTATSTTETVAGALASSASRDGGVQPQQPLPHTGINSPLTPSTESKLPCGGNVSSGTGVGPLNENTQCTAGVPGAVVSNGDGKSSSHSGTNVTHLENEALHSDREDN